LEPNLTDLPATGSFAGRRRFHLVACHVLWRELCHFASLSPHSYTFEFLRQGLHDTPDILRRELQAAVDRAPRDTEAVLVGYGLCSNGTAGIRARDKRLVLMRGHDCVTFFLGSKALYRRLFDENPGTYWYSSGWLETTLMPGPDRRRALRERYERVYGRENADFLMESEAAWVRNYSRAVYVETGVADEAGWKAYSRRCAESLGWEFREVRGDAGLFRRFLGGDWDPEDFLVVEPGRSVAASHDEGVVRSGDPQGT
jgi:hypothetical protein